MAHKTFISYKYSEARTLRDKIIVALNNDSVYYKGERADSPDMTDKSLEDIKNKLKDMIYDTSVTIVIISPNMKQSKWIEWEIEYSLKNVSRKDRTSQTNGIVGVIMEYNGGYSWFKKNVTNEDGCSAISYVEDFVCEIISKNRYNQDPPKYCCETCKTINQLTGSYIAYVEEEEFLKNPQEYIDNAYEKSENDASGYKITKTVENKTSE